MLKRYLLFSGMQYYPLGGWEDFQVDFDTLDVAKEHARKVGAFEWGNWAHIFDTQAAMIVWKIDFEQEVDQS